MKTNPQLSNRFHQIITGGARSLALLIALSIAGAGMAQTLQAGAAPEQRGLVAVVGGDDAAFLIAQSQEGNIVHAIDRDLATVEQAAGRIREAGLAGKVAVEQWREDRLPYTDNLVNVLVVRPGRDVPESEILRVLAPGGSATIKGKVLKKQRPEQIDDWPQYLYNATGQAMSKDLQVGPPKHLQWIGDPKWTRAHESYSSFGAMVSAAGRIFYVIDETPVSSTTLPPQFNVVARDAFNGVVLWRRPLEKWLTQHFPWKQGPYHLLRLLVATEKELYAPVGIDGDLAAYDTVTGRELRRYAGVKAPEELVLAGNTLLVVANPTPPDYDKMVDEYNKYRLTNAGYDSTAGKISLFNLGKKKLIAFRPDGAELWHHEAVVLPLTLAADEKVCVFHDGNKLQCLELASGKPLWATERKLNAGKITTAVPPSLAIFRDHVFLLAEKKLSAFSLADGRFVWERPAAGSDYGSPVSLFFLNGLVWSPDLAMAAAMAKMIGYDPATGESKSEMARESRTVFGHARCHRSKSTERYILTGTTGVEFVDPVAKSFLDHNWIRGACTYGIMPANGLLYVPPTSCACNPEEKINGLNVFAPERPASPAAKEDRLLKGPAYGQPVGAAAAPASPQDWPVYRHDYLRGNLSDALLPVDLSPSWKTDLGGPLSPPVAAEGVLLVSRKKANEVVCLNQETGKVVWRLTTGCPVDSPPAIVAGKAYFGCTDGYVYCVRLADGAWVWKFRAAPEERRIVAHERVESAWPVTGSVVVKDNAVYAVAGRSSFMDGGMVFVRLNAATGQLEKETPITSQELYARAKTKAEYGTGALQDVLIAHEGTLILRNLAFDPASGQMTGRPNSKYLIATEGLLENNWHHRHFLSYGQLNGAGFVGYSRWNQIGNTMISGRLLAFDTESVFGFGRNYYPSSNSRQFVNGEDYHLYRAPIDQALSPEQRQQREKEKGEKKDNSRNRDWSKENQIRRDWLIRPPFDAYALVVANRKGGGTGELRKTIVICGPKGNTRDSLEARMGRTGGELQFYDAVAGELAGSSNIGDIVPVFDGMIATQGRLLIAGMDGAVHSLAGRPAE